MVFYCCAYGCNESFVKGGAITFHSFPKNINRRKLWEIQLKRANFKATDYSKICSKHFEEECYDRTKFGGTWLRKDAIPTLFNFPDHFMNKTIKRKYPKEQLCDAKASVSQEQDSAQETRLKRRCYLGDFEESDMDSPTKARKVLHIAKTHASNQEKIIRNLRKREKCMKRRISSLTEILNELKKKSLIYDSASSVLELSLPEAHKQH